MLLALLDSVTMLTLTRILSLAVVLSSSAICQEGDPEPLDRRCLDCFCKAQTACNRTYGCTENVCGPYRIGYLYWVDGGRLGEISSDRAKEYFRACANNKKCSEKTIQNYMRVFQKDCNRSGGEPDCVDFFRIHIAGPNGCLETHLEERIEWLRFLECFLNTAPDLREALYSLGGKLSSA